jgi:hypothetical protein
MSETSARTLTPLWAIVVGGTLVGLFDFAYANLRTLAAGRAWQSVWKFVASALLGPEARSGGFGMTLAGIACHFTVAFSIVAAYVVVSRYWPLLTQHAVPMGMLYGAFVYCVMNWVVIPNTRLAVFPHPDLWNFLVSIAVHIFLIGLPAALFARRVRWQ